MKTTAIAPTNIALIKYWGKIDEVLKLPSNGSISMNLDSLQTTTTIDFSDDYKRDEIILNGLNQSLVGNRTVKHLDLIRSLAKTDIRAKIVTNNNFPMATGIASSASGFAALTVAASAALDLKLSEKDLSILARQGSGSACRSIPSGFVEWFAGDTSETSWATSIYPPDYWNIWDVVVIVDNEEKEVTSTAGQKLAHSNPFFATRVANLKNKIERIKLYLADRNFTSFGELIEAEALELHAIMLTSTPPLVYLAPQTLALMKFVKAARTEGLPVYYTLDAGPNIHLIVEGKNLQLLLERLKLIEGINKIVANKPGQGTILTDQHLF